MSTKDTRMASATSDIISPPQSEEAPQPAVGDQMETGSKTEEDKEGKGLEKLKILLSESGNDSVSHAHIP